MSVGGRIVDQVQRPSVGRDGVEAEVAAAAEGAADAEPPCVDDGEARPRARVGAARGDQHQLAPVRGDPARRCVVGDRGYRQPAREQHAPKPPLAVGVDDHEGGVMPGAPGHVGELRAGCGHGAGVDADHRQAVGGRHRRRGEQCGERRAEDDDGAREARASAHASSTGRPGRTVPQAASGIPDGSSKRSATSFRMSSIASVAGER